MEGSENQGVSGDSLLIMEEVLDMLKLLDYENKFCRQKGFKPVAKSFFAMPSNNPSEQFIYFVQLVSWLLTINNHQVSGWNKYDDPMTASQNVILELKKLGIELDMPPNKLKTGHGEGVCTVLQKLCQASLQNKFRFKKPVIREDNTALEEEGDDMGGDDLDGGQDIADMINQEINDDDEIEDFADFGVQGEKQIEQDQIQNQIIQSSITREEWMIEVERVAHKLKISKVSTDGKEWRSHLDQTKKYAENVKSSLPDVRQKLERLGDDVTKALEKISKKEGVLSRSFQGMTGDYRAHSDHLREIQNNFTQVSKNVQDLEVELSEINDRLSQATKRIDDTGKSFSDSSPLQKIKKAIAQVKNDIKGIDIRIGVVANTLLQLKLREKAKDQEDGKPMGAMENDYDIEL